MKFAEETFCGMRPKFDAKRSLEILGEIPFLGAASSHTGRS
jgi:hypothetical protein